MGYAGKRVLVTGADGFIGSHLVQALADAGAVVTALAAYNAFDQHGWLDDLPGATRGKLKLVRGDIRDAGFMLRLTDRQQVVFHLAALIGIPYSYTAPQSYIDTNVTGTTNVLEAARTCSVERVVNTSTSEVYGSAQFTPITELHPLQGQSPYSASKIAADMMVEAYARSFDFPVVTLRPFNTFGPRQSERAVIPTIIRQALDPACKAIKLGELTPKRDFNYVANTVDAFLALGTATKIAYGTAYNSGSGQAVSVGDVAAAICRMTSTDKMIVADTDRKRPSKSEVTLLLADSQRLAGATGWRSAVTLEQGLEKTVAWWRERFAANRVRSDSGYSI